MENDLMRETSFRKILPLAALLLAPELGLSQAPPQSGTLTVTGHSGQAPVIQVNGKSYVEIESVARLTNGSLSFQDSQIILTFPGAVANPAPPQTDQPAKVEGFSKDFLKAIIEEMTVIREWRSAIVNSIRNNYPVTEIWVSGYRRTADSKLALASAAAVTDADRNGLPLLSNEFGNMRTFSDKYLAMHESMAYISPDSLDGDQLDQQILNCAHGLASLAASGQFQDVPTCH
jgi:hypothetical protein